MAKRKTKPHPIDVIVGQRLRMAREAAGITQTGLADAVEITFQQIQKYESAANRISASRLVQLSRALDVDLSYFFAGTEAIDAFPAKGKN